MPNLACCFIISSTNICFYVARHFYQHWEYNSGKRKDKVPAYMQAYVIELETENKQINEEDCLRQCCYKENIPEDELVMVCK